ncbi:hypothetical protein B0H13DRAFT_2352463 [Mycena leptocephala]|nr:hypothetical protein B0H13DRAFT_2352463 [Mycena leptocephala]
MRAHNSALALHNCARTHAAPPHARVSCPRINIVCSLCSPPPARGASTLHTPWKDVTPHPDPIHHILKDGARAGAYCAPNHPSNGTAAEGPAVMALCPPCTRSEINGDVQSQAMEDARSQ